MSHESDVFPTILAEGDPTSGDEARFLPGSAENYRAFAPNPVLTDAELRAVELEFHEARLAWLNGSGTYEALLPLRDALGVYDPERRWHHDTRPLLVADTAITDEVLSDVAEDQVPDAGVLLERITGDPFARPTVGAMAALAFLETMGPGRRAIDAWVDEERDRALAGAANRADRAPPCLYVNGVPQLPLAPKMTPTGGPSGVYVARAYRLRDGWDFITRVDLPAMPELAPLIRRLEVDLWRLRTVERRSTWEDNLRRNPALLYRAASEGARAALKSRAP